MDVYRVVIILQPFTTDVNKNKDDFSVGLPILVEILHFQFSRDLAVADPGSEERGAPEVLAAHPAPPDPWIHACVGLIKQDQRL